MKVPSCGCRVDNVIMEYSPGVYDVGKRWDEYLDWPRMLSLCASSHPYLLLPRLSCSMPNSFVSFQ